jgi:hypothetical protein
VCRSREAVLWRLIRLRRCPRLWVAASQRASDNRKRALLHSSFALGSRPETGSRPGTGPSVVITGGSAVAQCEIGHDGTYLWSSPAAHSSPQYHAKAGAASSLQTNIWRPFRRLLHALHGLEDRRLAKPVPAAAICANTSRTVNGDFVRRACLRIPCRVMFLRVIFKKNGWQCQGN